MNHNLAEMTPVQIHRWTNRFQAEDGSERRIGDWIIAERLLIRRGDLIGRKKVVVEIPKWHDNNSDRDSPHGLFALGTFAIGKGNLKGRGTPVDFLSDEAKVPVLVDFPGGRKADEGATELLVLGQDSKLTVRNSRLVFPKTRSAGKDNGTIVGGANGLRKFALADPGAAIQVVGKRDLPPTNRTGLETVSKPADKGRGLFVF